MSKEFEIHEQVELATTPVQVWDLISTESGLAAWFMPMPMDANDDSIVAWEPGRRLRVETPTGDDGSTSAFEYLIEARDGGSTVLRFVHSGFISDDWGDEYETTTALGWEMYFATMAQYCEHFADRPATYLQAEGGETSASAGGWRRLGDRLFATPPALGDELQIALGGTVIRGEIDYLSPQFAGLRTDDALIRFHGRWPIGMSIAVSHHAYADVDAERLAAAWTGWLSDL